jgi:hypothetical protein
VGACRSSNSKVANCWLGGVAPCVWLCVRFLLMRRATCRRACYPKRARARSCSTDARARAHTCNHTAGDAECAAPAGAQEAAEGRHTHTDTDTHNHTTTHAQTAAHTHTHHHHYTQTRALQVALSVLPPEARKKLQKAASDQAKKKLSQMGGSVSVASRCVALRRVALCCVALPSRSSRRWVGR